MTNLKTTKLIGLGGYAFSGKDAVADVLEENGFYRTYMSKALENALLALDPWIDSYGTRYSQLHAQIGYGPSKTDLEVRRLLQRLGTEVGRNILGEDVWVDAAFREIEKGRRPDQRVVITGIRYPNELDRIKSEGGVSVWVSRPGYGPVNGHSSDNDLDIYDFDYAIDNRGSLDFLSSMVKGLML